MIILILTFIKLEKYHFAFVFGFEQELHSLDFSLALLVFPGSVFTTRKEDIGVLKLFSVLRSYGVVDFTVL